MTDMPIMATKIEVRITDDKGNVTTWMSDDFDWVEVEVLKQPQYFPVDSLCAATPETIARLSFHVERPKKYWIHAPHTARSLEDGDILDEG